MQQQLLVDSVYILYYLCAIIYAHPYTAALLLLCAAAMETNLYRSTLLGATTACLPSLSACLPSSRCNLFAQGASSPPLAHIRHHGRRFVPVRKDQGLCCDEPSTALACHLLTAVDCFPQASVPTSVSPSCRTARLARLPVSHCPCQLLRAPIPGETAIVADPPLHLPSTLLHEHQVPASHTTRTVRRYPVRARE